MFLSLLIFAATGGAAFMLSRPRLAKANAWRAAETRARAAPYAALTVLAVFIALFGASAEG